MNHKVETAGLTVEKYLQETLGLKPRSKIKKAILEREILCNGKPCKRDSILQSGDILEILTKELYRADELAVIPNAELELKVVHESSDFIVIDKPSGQNAHPLHPSETDTALNAITARYPETAQVLNSGKPLEGGLIHRIDRGTSGILVCARNGSFKDLKSSLKSEESVKLYLALVQGEVKTAGRIEGHLSHSPKNKKKMILNENEGDWFSATSFIPVLSHGNETLLLIRIHTGVTHQIRVHLSTLGHPIVGDVLYSENKIQDISLKPLDSITKETLNRFQNQLNEQTLLVWKKKNPEFFLHAFGIELPNFLKLLTILP